MPCLSRALLSLATLCGTALAASVQVNAPSAPPGDNVTAVFPNFLGMSLELSFINYYFGNDTSSIPQTMMNYLTALHQRGEGRPVRLRLGGNSMDSSTYVPDQQQIIEFTDPQANVNDQPVTYGEVLFNIMKTASDQINTQWLVGLSLRDANSTNTPLVAADAERILGDYLDATLLGNEPDLYTSHGNRPNIANYTVNDYIGDYWVATENLQKTSQGDFLSLNKVAGPTICCAWDMSAVLTSGWFQDFGAHLKYLTVQHYPQNHCSGSYQFHLDWYMSHTNTVNLAHWQQPALDLLASMPSDTRKPLLMDEFNSASCGGIPESNTFAMALWTADYALQMAAVGYSGAYLHTRERGVPYNLFDVPDAPAGASGLWTTNPNFYAMLAVNEALQSGAGGAGSRVVDLDVSGSVQDYAAVQAGYAIYNASTSQVSSIALFNYANMSAQGTDFALPASLFASSDGGDVRVRYLTAPSATETTDVSWGNLTYAGVGDGVPVTSSHTQWADKTVSCKGGCTVSVPGPGMAVVFVAGPPSNTTTTTGTPTANSGNASTSQKASGAGISGVGIRELCLTVASAVLLAVAL
ncbi:glycoside hydrolase family 79 protein [Trametopsis cervina]|nr:glycoside hydrolase family 79 protein [Trametopsis cervina]